MGILAASICLCIPFMGSNFQPVELSDWRSIWTPLTPTTPASQGGNRKVLSKLNQDPLRRFFGLQHFPGTGLFGTKR